MWGKMEEWKPGGGGIGSKQDKWRGGEGGRERGQGDERQRGRV